MTEYSVFGTSSPPGSYNAYQDGLDIRVGQTFYISPGDLDATRDDLWVVGARLFWTSGDGITYMELRAPFAGYRPNAFSMPLVDTTEPKSISSGWNEFRFNNPWKITGNSVPWMVSYRGVDIATQLIGPKYYGFAANARSEGAFGDSDGLYWAENSDSLFGTYFAYDGDASGSASATAGWGIDTVVEKRAGTSTPSRSGKLVVAGSQHPVRIWDGSAWVPRPVKTFDGTSWTKTK